MDDLDLENGDGGLGAYSSDKHNNLAARTFGRDSIEMK